MNAGSRLAMKPFRRARGLPLRSPVAAGLQRHEGWTIRFAVAATMIFPLRRGEPVRGAESVHQAAAFHAQTRLERAGRIVDSRVDDAAVVGARVEARTRMSFDHADGKTTACDGGGGGESGDSGADHGHVDLLQSQRSGFRSYIVVQFRRFSSHTDEGERGGPRMREKMTKRALITGITGQDGSYLAELLLEKGYEVFGMVRRSSAPNFWRIEHLRDRITLKPADLLDQLSLIRLLDEVRPHELYNLAAMSFVPASWDQPMLTGEFNAQGVTRVLDAVRQRRSVDPPLPGFLERDVRQGPRSAADAR